MSRHSVPSVAVLGVMVWAAFTIIPGACPEQRPQDFMGPP